MLVEGFTHAQYGSQSAACTGRGSPPPLSGIPVARAVKKTAIEGDKSTWSTLDSQCILSENPERCQVYTKLRSETRLLPVVLRAHRAPRAPVGRVFFGCCGSPTALCFGCPPKRVLCDSRCNTKLPELELGQKPPIFVAGSSQAGGIRYPA